MNIRSANAARQATTLQSNYPKRMPSWDCEAKTEHANEAIPAYQQAISQKPGYGIAYTGLGIHILNEAIRPALTPYEQAIRISPNNARVRYNLDGLTTISHALLKRPRTWLKPRAETGIRRSSYRVRFLVLQVASPPGGGEQTAHSDQIERTITLWSRSVSWLCYIEQKNKGRWAQSEYAV